MESGIYIHHVHKLKTILDYLFLGTVLKLIANESSSYLSAVQ
jgi:hypothetical protein